MSPLIGRTCTVWISETTRFSSKSSPVTTPAHEEHAIIMDVQPVYLAESAGSLARTRGDGWNLLCLLEGGALMSFEHHEVTVK